MEYSKLIKLTPATPEAWENGCKCERSKVDPETIYIAKDCPLHWYINMTIKNDHIHEHVIRQDKLNAGLYAGLYVLAIFLSIVFMFKSC